MIIFDGKAYARERMHILKARGIFETQKTKMWSLAFLEDSTGIKYAELKAKDADFLGIEYEQSTISLSESIEKIQEIVQKAGEDATIQGIIIQKPAKELISDKVWSQLVSIIPLKKDVDGLRLDSVLLPATARAIAMIVQEASRKCEIELGEKKAIVIGRSSIVGAPSAKALIGIGMKVENWGKKDLENKRDDLQLASLVVCATGQSGLLRAGDFRSGQQVILIDAGAPSPEIVPEGLEAVAAFLTPVPGGVGPVTRVCLLENLQDLVQSQSV